MKLSIIMPIYNAMPHVKDAIMSILDQDEYRFQLILVNDGSNDGSEILCNSIARKDKRVVVINNVNSGLCYSRNIGIAKSDGEYLWFVDADDLVVGEKLCELINLLEELEDTDIILSNYIKMREGRFFQERIYEYNLNYINQAKPLEVISYLWGKLGINWAVWNKIYRRQYIIDHKLYFDESVYYEDGDFNLNAVLNAKKFAVFDSCIYVYRVDNEMSLSHKRKTFDNFKDAHQFCVKWYDFFVDVQSIYSDKLIKRLKYSYQYLLSFISELDIADRREALELYKSRIEIERM